jgi:uncharacterized protein (DUF952 family)
MDGPLLHIAPRDRWDAAQTSDEAYTDPSLEAEGFIHLSTPAQVLIPANERFAGRTDLVLLVIDPERLDDEVIFEDCYESGMEFPHLYGPLPIDAVTRVLDFVPSSDGTFTLPTAL